MTDNNDFGIILQPYSVMSAYFLFYNLYRPSFECESPALRFVTFKNKPTFKKIFIEVQSVTVSPQIRHVMLCNNLFLL